MKRRIVAFGVALILAASTPLQVQYATTDSSFKRCFVGSTLFMMGNFAQSNRPDFVQLNWGYRLTEKDVVSKLKISEGMAGFLATLSAAHLRSLQTRSRFVRQSSASQSKLIDYQVLACPCLWQESGGGGNPPKTHN